MNIGFDISDLATGRADGTTRYTTELARRMPSLAAQASWHYFTPATSGVIKTIEEQQANVTIYTSPWPKYWTQLRLPFELLRTPLDTLFMPIQQLPIMRPRQMRTVAVVHDLAVHEFGQQYRYKDWLLLHAFSAQAIREADMIIAVSQATALDIAKYYGRTEGVVVIPHGLDHTHFRLPTDTEKNAARVELTTKYPVTQHPYLLFVGQIQPRKNLERLIKAFELLAAAQPDLHLVIAGSHGWLQQPIVEAVAASPFTSRIAMIGRVDDTLLPSLYWQAQVFILPSLNEGFGLPVLEAMACGTPVVTSNLSCLPEVAGQAAVLVDPYQPEAIAAGIKQAQQEASTLREKGIEQAALFTWEKTAAKTLQVVMGQV